MANHLIIGLGGTGGSIVRELRKRIYEEYDSNTPDGNITVDYIYMDSDENDLNDKDNKWNYLGNSVILPPSSRINIHGMGAGVLSNLGSYPGIKAFISPEDNELFRDRSVSDIIGTGIGGQRRRFGRLLFANNLANAPLEEQFPHVFVEKLTALKNKGDSNVTIHICAGLAGGTGSGTVVDVITQIHKMVQGEVGADGNSPYPIFLYLYVPEIIVAGNKDSGFYHANGYAALMELNAMSVGKYLPLDISPNNMNIDGKPWRMPARNGEPFKKAYLFTTNNAKGCVLPAGEKLSGAVADFLFQKMLGTSNAMNRLINAENSGCQPDTNDDGQPMHSRNFMTFGIKRVVYPESEIRGFIGYNTTMSVVKQLVYNNWVDRAGYQHCADESSVALGLDTEVKTPGNRDGYQLSDQHLTLQKPIAGFEDTADWCDFNSYWNKINAFMAKKTMENNPDSHQWKNAYLQMMNVTFGDNFRNVGVKRFFDIQCQPENVKRFARVITNHIEAKLFDEWVNGQHGDKPQSLQKVKMILLAIQADCSERVAGVGKVIDATTKQLNQEIMPNITRAINALDDTGFLARKLLDKDKQHFNDFTVSKVKEYIARTQLASYDFARLVLEEISHMLTAKIAGVQNLINLLNLTDERLNAASTFITASPANNGVEINTVERVFDVQSMIQNTEDRILKDAALQKEIGKKVRDELRDRADSLGKGRSFGVIYTSLGGLANANFTPSDDQENTDGVVEFLQKLTFGTVSDKLDNIAKNEPDNQFLRVNVLKKIQQEYPTETALREYLVRLVDTARPFAMMDNAAGAVVGAVGNAQYSNFIQLCLPDYEDAKFRNDFIKAFADVAKWGANYEGTISVNSHSNELLIISGTSNVPIRMLANVRTLKQKYQTKTSEAANANAELDRMLLHTESLPKGVMPDLFSEDPGLRSRRIKGYAMRLHSDEGTIVSRQDEETGNDRNAIVIGSGLRRKSQFVGRDMEETARMMEEDANLRTMVIKLVDDAIMPKYTRNADRASFREAIENKVVAEILEGRCHNNETNQLFKDYCEAAEYLFENDLNDR